MNYFVPMTVLVVTFVGFLALNRGHHRQSGVLQAVLRMLAALPLLFSGVVLHFFRTADAASIVPPGFPAPTALVYLTGVLEVAGAIGLFVPRFRKMAGLCIVLLMIAVFPANIYAAGKIIGGVQMPGIVVRTVMQVVYILLVLVAGYGVPVSEGSGD